MMCATNGSVKVMRLLLSLKPNVNLQDSYGYTALMLAAIANHVEIVKLLLDYGANVSIENNVGCKAINYSHDKEISNLLKAQN